jgi:tetratricopeptide (TPR) repeat protein
VAADKELRPWLTRGTNNVEAMKAFLTYSRYALRSEPGGAPYLDRAVALDPTFVSARVWRIPSLVETGRIRQAQEDYRVLQELALRASAFDQAMIDWVGAFLSGDPASEVRHLERALQYAPDNNILLVNLAESRLANGDLPGAMKALEPALRIRWSYPALYTLQGAILIRQGRFAEAKGALGEAAGMPVVDAGVYGMLSALCRRDREGAEADRYQALFAGRSEQLGWDAAEQQDVLGGYLASVGLYGPAVRALRQAVALGPGSPARHVHLADALRQAGRPAEAAAACARALELDPQSPTAHLVLARVHEDRRQPVEALREYEAYLATGPKGASSRDVEARVAQLRRTQMPLPSRR